jgi:hypothetical protein
MRHLVQRDAEVRVGHRVAVDVVDAGMDVLPDAGVVGEPEREAVVRSQPHAVRAMLVEDAPHAAELFAAEQLAGHHAGPRVDVEVRDPDAAAHQRHLVGVAALVDGGVGLLVVGERPAIVVPLVLAAGLALVADEGGSGGAAGDAHHRRRVEAGVPVGGRAVGNAVVARDLPAQVAVGMQAVGEAPAVGVGHGDDDAQPGHPRIRRSGIDARVDSGVGGCVEPRVRACIGASVSPRIGSCVGARVRTCIGAFADIERGSLAASARSSGDERGAPQRKGAHPRDRRRCRPRRRT